MANTTNYNWETPDDTDLVKDGALAIRTLGSSIDTTTKALNPSTTLGDIEYRSSTANTNTRLGIGTTGQVLTVAGGVPSWANAAGGGGMTLINTGGTSFSGSSFTISSIPTTYKTLKIIAVNWGINAAGYTFLLANGSSTLYTGKVLTAVPSTVGAANKNGEVIQFNEGQDISGSQTNNFHVVEIENYFSTTEYKQVTSFGNFAYSGNFAFIQNVGELRTTSAITSLQFTTNQTFNAGKVYVYGVN